LKLSDKEASLIIKKILEGVNYIHNKGIIHRDLKPSNIMVPDTKDFNQIKIIDFNIGILKERAPFDEKICGTYSYMAPEILNN